MVKQCKYIERNSKEGKCIDYFVFHKPKGDKVMCRLTEWKRKLRVCPYDKSIKSCSKRYKDQKLLL